MKTWNPSELEDGILDYLYDELEPEERRSFERALEARPDLVAELERHRFVRGAARGLAPIPVPTVALQNVLAAADAEAERRRHAGGAGAVGGAGFWARVRGWVMHPAFATASVAFVVAGVGLTMSQSGVGGAGETGSEQRVPARMREAVAVRDEPVAAKPLAAAVAKAEARELEKEAQSAGVNAALDPAAPAAPAFPPEKQPVAEPAGSAVAPAPPGLARTAGAAGRAVPASNEAGSGVEWAKPSADIANDDTAGRVNVAGGAETAKKLADEAEVAGLAGDSDVVAAAKDGGFADAKGKTRDEGARLKAVEAVVKLDTASKENQLANGPGRVAEAPAPRVDNAGNDAKQPAVVQPAETTDRKPQDRERVAVQPNMNTNRTPTYAPRAADGNDAAKSPGRLWTTYGQQMAAGAWSDAAKTLGEIEKFGTEPERVNQARAELKKRAQVATEPAKENASKLPDPGLKPGDNTKTNKP